MRSEGDDKTEIEDLAMAAAKGAGEEKDFKGAVNFRKMKGGAAS